MSDYVLTDGDLANFLPIFGSAIVTVRPGILMGGGKAKLLGKKQCVYGDEKKVMVPGCMYISGSFSIPGAGTLMIQSLAPNQKAMKTKDCGRSVLLKGMMFTAKFQVMVPAMMPVPLAPPVPDPVPFYPGQGNFITTNIKYKAT